MTPAIFLFSFWAATLVVMIFLRLVLKTKLLPHVYIVALPLAWTLFVAGYLLLGEQNALAMIALISIAGMLWSLALAASWIALIWQMGKLQHPKL